MKMQIKENNLFNTRKVFPEAMTRKLRNKVRFIQDLMGMIEITLEIIR